MAPQLAKGKTKRGAEQLGDEELMVLCERRESAAFEVLYDRHGTAAYSLAYRVVGDAQTAEDVVQEAFISIWRNGARYDAARGSVRSWALGIVRNRAIDTLRRVAIPVRQLDHDDDAALETRAAPEDTGSEAIRRETAGRLRGLLGKLPNDQSEVIGLAYFGGFTHSEIASMLGVPLGTVKGRMRLGLEKIRTGLAEGMSITEAEQALP